MELNQKDEEVETELSGMPVSIGEVTGTARVVKSLSQAHHIQVSLFLKQFIYK